jgi:hypothetical protein
LHQFPAIAADPADGGPFRVRPQRAMAPKTADRGVGDGLLSLGTGAEDCRQPEADHLAFGQNSMIRRADVRRVNRVRSNNPTWHDDSLS